ncbi:hypothetical protein PG993_006804 [Apiospora rasikravindrae]|uniref:Uncharacterized protein n=1 Tax=Apiospora rasikravindrae TaxID=990691 RepID=A0ABR1T6P8_9PEZI
MGPAMQVDRTAVQYKKDPCRERALNIRPGLDHDPGDPNRSTWKVATGPKQLGKQYRPFGYFDAAREELRRASLTAYKYEAIIEPRGKPIDFRKIPKYHIIIQVA